MTKTERVVAIGRRLSEKKGGLGYLAALDAVKNHQAEYIPFKKDKTK
jgi:hypothetical protein